MFSNTALNRYVLCISQIPLRRFAITRLTLSFYSLSQWPGHDSAPPEWNPNDLRKSLTLRTNKPYEDSVLRARMNLTAPNSAQHSALEAELEEYKNNKRSRALREKHPGTYWAFPKSRQTVLSLS